MNKLSIKQSFPEKYRKTLESAKALGFNGFGGNCGVAAVAINRVVFKNKGKIVGGLNAYLLENFEWFIGHIAVEFEGSYWDSDGKEKAVEEIESWGQIDPEDPEYKERVEDLGGELTEERAYDSGIYELSEEEALQAFGDRGLDEMLEILKKTV